MINTIVQLQARRRFTTRECDYRPQEGTVPVRVHSVGICGSDIHYFMEGKCGPFVPQEPLSLGHEFSGCVVASTAGFVAGDRVVVDPLLSCGECDMCRSGRRNLCPKKRYMGSAAVYPHVQGAMRTFIDVPAENVYRLPEAISYTTGAMIEPTAVALKAYKSAGDLTGRRVLITGGGAIGQLLLKIVVAYGHRATMCDPRSYARDTADRNGATEVIDPARATIPAMSYDVVFEVSGAKAAFVDNFRVVRKGGTVVQVGTLPDDAVIEGNTIMTKALRFVGSLQYATEFGEVMDLIADNVLAVEDLKTHSFDIHRTAEAISFAAQNPESMKVHITL